MLPLTISSKHTVFWTHAILKSLIWPVSPYELPYEKLNELRRSSALENQHLTPKIKVDILFHSWNSSNSNGENLLRGLLGLVYFLIRVLAFFWIFLMCISFPSVYSISFYYLTWYVYKFNQNVYISWFWTKCVY